MELLRDFRNISKSDVSLAGGKGASLGEMTQAGISVPNGFVILANAFEKFLEETDLNVEIDSILDSVNHKEIHTIERASEKIKALILQAEMPRDIIIEIKKFFKNLNSKYVAVRSSATAEDSASAAWAGQLDSFLNTTEEILLENVKKCWASLFTPRAIFYRFEKDLHKKKISVAVVVQKMIESEKSGIAFSVHPVTQDKNQLIIEAGFGLGEAIVSGQITPDSYVVEKQPRRIIDKNVQTQSRGLYRADKGGNEWRDIPKEQGEKQILSDEEILELSEIILKIENHYNFPCDIEWAFEGGKFYIVQSRPITTLSESNQEKQKENWLVVVSFKTELLTEAIIHRGYRESLPELLPKIPKFRNRMIIDNDIYIDLTETSKIQEYFSSKTIKKCGEVYKTIEQHSKNFIRVSKECVKNLKGISDKELSTRLQKFFKAYEKTIGAIGVPTIIDLIIEVKLKSFLEESRIKNIDEVLARLAIPHKIVETSKERLALLALAGKINKKELSLESKEASALIWQHYKKFGWLHSTLFLGKLYDKQEIRKELVKIGHEADRKIDELKKDRKEHVFTAKSVISKIKSSEGRKLAKFFQKAVYYRTARLEWMNEACFIVRSLLEETAKRLSVGFNDIIYLLPEELIDSLNNKKINSGVIKSIKERQNGYAYISNNDQEYLLATGGKLKELKSKFSKSYEQEEWLIRGVVAFKGTAKGTAVIVKDRDDLYKVKEGDVLITRLTTPDFVVAMKKASAIVTDLGGITSHAAITSRELKIPCVVGTKNATKSFKDGDMVEVDGDNGTIRKL